MMETWSTILAFLPQIAASTFVCRNSYSNCHSFYGESTINIAVIRNKDQLQLLCSLRLNLTVTFRSIKCLRYYITFWEHNFSFFLFGPSCRDCAMVFGQLAPCSQSAWSSSSSMLLLASAVGGSCLQKSHTK